MAWINKEGKEMHHMVPWICPNVHQSNVAHEWCRRHIGELGENWVRTHSGVTKCSFWWFLEESDAVLFRLTWT